MQLAIDIETFSETDIKFGIHKYCENPAFEITLFAYKLNDNPIEIIDLASGEEIDDYILDLLYDEETLKTAYNAAFEITCLNQYLLKIGLYKLFIHQWSCTQALAAQAGLPFGLDNVAKVLGTIEQKDKVGKELIKYFALPCKPTKANGMRTRNLPQHDFDKWLDFKAYCCQDVATEVAIRKELNWFKVCDFEKDVWALDQKINNLGVAVDTTLVNNAIKIDEIETDRLKAEMVALTNIDNPKSAAQVKKFIESISGEEIKSLNKTEMPAIRELFKDESTVLKVLSLREKLSRTSIKKYLAIQNSVCKDGRVRGLFQYYGANRTGRFAGRNVQLQNLKRNDLKDLNFARLLVRHNNLDVLNLTYSDVGSVLSNLIRTAFIPGKNKKLVASDLSAIEARIVAWLANELWRLDVFKTHGKIYEASAAMMFSLPLESITKDLRQRGKIAELALGYQGGLGAMQRMGGGAMGLSDDEMSALVKKWRKANPKIVKFWYAVQEHFVEAIQGEPSKLGCLKFYKKNGHVLIELPSGRPLVYINAAYKNDRITYYGLNQETKQWGLLDTYGGKLVENITQALARDVLVNSMLELDKLGFNIIMHVHDEIVVDEDSIVATPKADILKDIMSKPISWAPGLPLGAETFIADFYQK